MTQTLQTLAHTPDSASTLPGRDLPINDPPPADGSQPPVQDPPVQHPDPTLRQNGPVARPAGTPPAEQTAEIEADWADDDNPEAHESAV